MAGRASARVKGFGRCRAEEAVSGSSTDHYNDTLHDAVHLALVTGARLGELCDLKRGDVEHREDGWWITIREGKTEAAARSVPLHGSVDAITQKRVATKTLYLFQDLIPGGPDEKRMWYVSKAFRRYRDKVGVAEQLERFSRATQYVHRGDGTSACDR